MQLTFNATSLRLLPFQLGFVSVQYISLS